MLLCSIRHLLGPRRSLGAKIQKLTMSTSARSKITLSPAEAEICGLLKQCAQRLGEKRPEIPPVELRLAGGWVRDKLLGVPSHDLDVAISSMTGETFAMLFYDFLKDHESKQKMKQITKIMANPDKSKHLETAHTVFLDHEIDFAHLRKEVYEEQSRIPKVEFGTPLEDAERRDFTINSLFYNIHSEEVEDLTGKGLEDLSKRLIRTPLDPKETFKDDPLRILRGIRFASRLGFELDDAIGEAAKDESIRRALELKISRERVGVELDKMLEDTLIVGPSPVHALGLIEEFGLYPIVFTIPSNIKATFKPSNACIESKIPTFWTTPTPSLPTILSKSLSKFQSFLTSFSSLHSSLQRAVNLIKDDKNLRRRMYLAISLLPHLDKEFEEKKRVKWVGEKVMVESLKRSNEDRDFVGHLFAKYKEVGVGTKRLVQGEGESKRSEIGQILRSMQRDHANGPRWNETLLFSLTLDLILSDSSETEILNCYYKFCEQVSTLGLINTRDSESNSGTAFEECRLNGSDMQKILNISGGPHLGLLKNIVLNFQLDNPKAMKGECGEWLRGQWEEETGEVRDVRREVEMRGVKRKK